MATFYGKTPDWYGEPTPYTTGSEHPWDDFIRPAASGLLGTTRSKEPRERLQALRPPKHPDLDVRSELLLCLRLARWVDAERSQYLPWDGVIVRAGDAPHLRQAVEKIIEAIRDTVTWLESPDAHHEQIAQNLVSHLPHIADQLRARTPEYTMSTFLSTMDGAIGHDDIESARQQIADIERLHASAEAKTAHLVQYIEKALLAGLASEYGEIANASAGAAKRWLIGLWVTLGAGLVALAVLFWFWWAQIVDHDQLTVADTVALLTLKIPAAIAWLWALRVVSRQYSAATHREAVAKNKRAALITFELLQDSIKDDGARGQLLNALAPLVFDPTGSGITDDHRDAVSIGPQSFTVGK